MTSMNWRLATLVLRRYAVRQQLLPAAQAAATSLPAQRLPAVRLIDPLSLDVMDLHRGSKRGQRSRDSCAPPTRRWRWP
jgi:hypothetical protein